MPNSKRLLLLLALFAPMFAAIPATAIWRVSTLGSNTNGGAWDSAGTGSDMSQFPSPNSSGCTAGTSCFSSTANLSETTASTNGTTTITTHNSSAYSSALTGNIVYISGATTTGLATATYSSGGSFTGGSGSSTCILLGFNNSGIQVMATMAVSGTTPGTITVVYPGNGFTSAPTSVTAYPGVGSAACTGTVTITSTLGNSAGWYRATYASSTTFTVDRNIPTGTSGNNLTVNIGGALADVVTSTLPTLAGNNVCVKADGAYSVSTSIIFLATGGNGSPIVFQGYTSTCGVNGTASDNGQAAILATQALPGIFIVENSNIHVYNFSLDNGSYTGTSRGFQSLNSNGYVISNVVAKNFATAGFSFTGGSPASAINIRATGGLASCTAGIYSAIPSFVITTAISDQNNCPGFEFNSLSGVFSCTFCIAANNIGSTADGFYSTSTSAYQSVMSLVASASYGNGGSGVNMAAAGVIAYNIRNSAIYGNTGSSIKNSAGPQGYSLNFDYNAYASGTLSNVKAGPHDVILTADPFVNGASLNFALNSTAGGGAALKAAGFPGALQAGGTGYISIGPLQPQASSSTATACPIGYGICP